MEHTYLIDIKRDHPLYGYFKEMTEKAGHLYNRSLFLLRNAMTALAKEPSARMPLELEALDDIFSGIDLYNDTHEKQYEYPTEEKWLLGKYCLTSILQVLGDHDYESLPAQVNQRTVAKARDAMLGFARACKAYKKDPKAFTGLPKLPDYKKGKPMTVSFSNQVCTIKHDGSKQYLKFPHTGETLYLGKKHYPGKLQAVEVIPKGQMFRICITFEDGIEYEPLPDNGRYYAIDLGVKNFAAVIGNFEMRPFIVNGGHVMSVNQIYNKMRAGKQSLLPAGIFVSNSLVQDSIKRERTIRDIFYKDAHFICRKAVEDDVHTIVCGWNNYIKNGSNLGNQNNQNFVQIPHARFIDILTCVAMKYGITVVRQEESYTSDASFLDGDGIPVYKPRKKGDAPWDMPQFSGRRVKRGLYRSNNGTVINADINAALNILRKYNSHAFDDMKSFECFLKDPVKYDVTKVPSYKCKSKPRCKRNGGSSVLPVAV